jgi:hypothetical protein
VKKKRPSNPKRRLQVAIAAGVIVIAIVIALSYNFDQAGLKGQKFGNDLALIQSDLKNETQIFDYQLSLYEKGQLSKSEMLNITYNHIEKMQNFLIRYDNLSPPEPFVPSLQLFRLSTQTQLESDKLIQDWIQTGDNATRVKSDALLQQSFQYEMNALQSFNNAKSKGLQ